MKRVLVGTLAMLAVALPLAAQEGIQRGRIKKIDPAKKLLVVTVDGKERSLTLTDGTRLPDGQGRTLAERLHGYPEGAEVFFKAERRDGREVAWGVKRVAGGGRRSRPSQRQVDTSKLVPLPELGAGTYQGFPGGLYPDGKNERPRAHEAAGLALARQVQPLDAQGKPAADGKIVLLSIGMSNTTQEFSTFQRLARADRAVNPKLVIVDGAQGGMSADRIVDPNDKGSGTRFWDTADGRLRAAGVTRAQVEVAWIKQADPGPRQGFPAYARKLQGELRQIVQVSQRRFPNLKLVYLSSRIYGGYARTALNPEPYAYESGFAVKWLIAEQIEAGAVKAPWLSWGPYLWVNGTKKRSDGLFYEASDFAGDGTHPAESGRRKVAEHLLRFFQTDPTANPWFVR